MTRMTRMKSLEPDAERDLAGWLEFLLSRGSSRMGVLFFFIIRVIRVIRDKHHPRPNRFGLVRLLIGR